MKDEFAKIFTAAPSSPPADPDPFDSEDYQKFVESMVPYCHCADKDRPCDGVLAGGLCDCMGHEPAPEDDDGWVDWEEDDS